MKDSIVSKLESLQERHQEISGLLSDPDVISDQNQFRKLSVEYSQLEPNKFYKYYLLDSIFYFVKRHCQLK